MDKIFLLLEKELLYDCKHYRPGPVFNVAQDEPTSKDNIYVVDDKYNIIINQDLCTQFTVVNIYYRSNLSYSDFYITTDLEWKDEYHYCEWGKPW